MLKFPDQSQLEVINSSLPRIAVIAPAGYGKTATIVSKLIHDIKSGLLPNHRKALAITFSVNAARKMRNELDKGLSYESISNNKVWCCNYHRLARRILKLYACPVLNINVDIDSLSQCDENNILKGSVNLDTPLSFDQNKILGEFRQSIIEFDSKKLLLYLEEYCNIVNKCLIPYGLITYNGILALALLVLLKSPIIKMYYQELYPYVIIDEAQDTNILCYELLKQLIGDKTRINIFGDPYQRIYGFNGAIPNILEIITKEYGLYEMELKYNHRFAKDSNLFLLDSALRHLLANSKIQNDEQLAMIKYSLSSSIESEVDAAYEIINYLCSHNKKAKIAVLVKQRNCFANCLINRLKDCNFTYFNCLYFTDSDEFSEFNDDCLSILNNTINKYTVLPIQSFDKFILNASKAVLCSNYEFKESYYQLLQAFKKQIHTEYQLCDPSTRYELVFDVLSNRSLQHSIEYIDEQIIISTIHAAKGLEWDYVLLPDMIKWIFPSSTTCIKCTKGHQSREEGNRCIPLWQEPPDGFIDDLCLFYVAVTRAKKEAICLASTERIDSKGKLFKGFISCLLELGGIESIKI